MNAKTWAEEIAESEEALQNARRAARHLWMAYEQALKEADAAEQQLVKLRIEGPAKPGEKEKV